MGMIQRNISDEDRQILAVERFEHPHPRVQRKMEAVCLTSMGVSRGEVARLVQRTEGTVRSSVSAYRDGGIKALRRFNPHPHTAALDAQADTLRAAFEAQPPHTGQEAVDRIEKLTSVRRSTTQVGLWLKKGVSAAQNRANPRESRPGPATRISGDRAHAGLRGSPGESAACVFPGCRALRVRRVAWVSLVSDPDPVTDALWASTV